MGFMSGGADGVITVLLPSSPPIIISPLCQREDQARCSVAQRGGGRERLRERGTEEGI
jgi:hypothetical protein